MRSAFTRAVLCLGLLACAGCNLNPAKPCKVDPECGEGGFCDEASGICQYIPPPPMLRWEAPADNARVRADVRLMVSVDAGTSRVALPAELPYSVQPGDGGGTLFQDGGVYEGTWTTGAEGTYTLVAYLRNGLPDGGTVYSKPLRLTVDRTPPVLTVSVPVPARPDGGSTTIHVDPAGDPAAYHRDEIAPVRVTSTADDVDLASLVVKVTGLRDGGAPATMLTGMSACDGGSGFCGTVPLELWRPELQAFRGSFLVEARGADLAGNVAGAAQASVPVTRWKWSFDGGAGANIKATPAIGHEGTIYIGTTAGWVGNLYAVNPDGVLRWSTSVGSVQASPAVGAWDGGSETVYVAGNSTIYAIDGADGGPRDSYTLTSAATNGSLSLANAPPSAPVESAVAVVNRSTNATLVAFQPGKLPNAISLDNQPALNYPMGVVVTNGARFSWGSSTRLYNYGFDAGTWTTASPGSVPMPSHVQGLTLAADRLIGTIGTFGEGALFDVSVGDGGVRLYPDNPATAHPAWGLALARDSKVIYSDGAPRLVTFDLASQSPSVSTPMATAILTAPVVGADNMVYTVAYDGTVNARTPDLTLDWALTLPGTVDSSPNLDCSRDSSGVKQPGRPGILYVGSNNGQLYAIVVDSRGIDTQAAWPKYQHDPRNTGNSTTDLGEFACP